MEKMRRDASEAARAKCMYMATTTQPSSAASSLMVAGNILWPPVIIEDHQRGVERGADSQPLESPTIAANAAEMLSEQRLVRIEYCVRTGLARTR